YPRATPRRTDALDGGPEGQELAIRVLEVLEWHGQLDQLARRFPANRVELRAPVRMHEGTEIAQRRPWHAETNVEPWPLVLEPPGPVLPELRELEVRRPVERVVAHAHRHEARDAIDAHARASVRDEVPRPRLEHEPQRVERASHCLRAFPVPRRNPAATP